MPLFRTRDFFSVFLPFIVGSASLSALDIPVELPSGELIHLQIEDVCSRRRKNSHSVSIKTQITDPEALRLIFKNDEVVMQISSYLQEKWHFHNFYLLCVFSSLMDQPSIFDPTQHTITLSEATIIHPGISQIKANVPISSDTSDEKGTPSETGFSSSSPSSELLCSQIMIPSAELHLAGSAEPDNQKAIPNSQTLWMDFSIPSSSFGGDWILTPYELRFIKHRSSFKDQKGPKNTIDLMVSVLGPDISEFYLKGHDNPNFFSVDSTVNSLRENLNGTYTYITPSQGKFIFNKEGELIYSIGPDGISHVFYYYSNGRLTEVHHKSTPFINFEYKENQLVSISGLPHKIHCQYDERNFLCRVLDEQGAFIHFSYDEYDFLSKIVDDSGTTLFFIPDDDDEDSPPYIVYDPTQKKDQTDIEIPILFNDSIEIIYYKNSQNVWKFNYRDHFLPEEDEQDE